VVVVEKNPTGDGHIGAVVPRDHLGRSGNSWSQIPVPYLVQAGKALSQRNGQSVFDASDPVLFSDAFPGQLNLGGAKIEIFVIKK